MASSSSGSPVNLLAGPSGSGVGCGSVVVAAVVVAFTVVVEASVSKVVSDVLSDLPEQELTAKKAIAIYYYSQN
jgi:hypothetical protein